jgi:hypothetical protein
MGLFYRKTGFFRKFIRSYIPTVNDQKSYRFLSSNRTYHRPLFNPG